jgi:PAS domain S-box-containing protein
VQRLSDSTANRRLTPEVLEQALHATDIMLVLTDPREEDNPIVWVNDYFCEFTGYSRDEVIGRNCRFLQGADRDQPGRHRVREAVEEGEGVHVQLRNYRKDGSPFANDLFVSPVREDRDDPESSVLYFVGVQNDSTARLTAEAEVAEREREVHETAENERERFGMDLHDGLGQELAGVSLLARAHADRLAAEGSEHADAAARILDLLESALGSARDMARGLNPVDASEYGLGDALRMLCASVDAASPHLTVRARVEPVEFEDRRDARHLYRIAQEAVSNAVKHAEATRITVTLHRAPGPGGTDTVHLEVRDDGAGVDPSLLEAGWDGDGTAQSRAELARRGMGLYGMRYRAELIGATFHLDAPDEGGTVVRCVLHRGASASRTGHRVRHAERE